MKTYLVISKRHIRLYVPKFEVYFKLTRNLKLTQAGRLDSVKNIKIPFIPIHKGVIGMALLRSAFTQVQNILFSSSFVLLEDIKENEEITNIGERRLLGMLGCSMDFYFSVIRHNDIVSTTILFRKHTVLNSIFPIMEYTRFSEDLFKVKDGTFKKIRIR